jgi:hypothetical protein
MNSFTTYFNIDNSRSYLTEAGLLRAIEKKGWADHKFIIVRNREGQYTAIFSASQIQDGDMTRYARYNFMTIG